MKKQYPDFGKPTDFLQGESRAQMKKPLNYWKVASGLYDIWLIGGSSTWARTRDLRINSPALYQLSY
jgi:hypothetical protein